MNYKEIYTEGDYYYFNKSPTEYDIDYDTPYLKSLGENLLSDIKIFWTGNETLSHRITKESFNRIYSILNREIIIWDNAPVNDFESDKELIFIAPYENRSPYLCNNHLEGIVLNSMDRWEVSKFTIKLKIILSYLITQNTKLQQI